MSTSRPATSATTPRAGSSSPSCSAGEREVVGVCNNAGFGNLGHFLDLDLEQEVGVVRVNVEAVHELTGAFLPRMVEQGSGAILNVASTAAFQPLPGFATYAASKAFVHSFSEAVHSELVGHRRVGHLAVPRLHPHGVRGGRGRRGRRLEAPRLHLDGVRRRRAPGGRGHARRQAHRRAGRASTRSVSTSGRYTPRTVLLPLIDAPGH